MIPKVKEHPEQLLTVKDVAARCKVSLRTVRDWSKKLPHFPQARRQGKVIRWRESEVNAFVENFGR